MLFLHRSGGEADARSEPQRIYHTSIICSVENHCYRSGGEADARCHRSVSTKQILFVPEELFATAAEAKPTQGRNRSVSYRYKFVVFDFFYHTAMN